MICTFVIFQSLQYIVQPYPRSPYKHVSVPPTLPTPTLTPANGPYWMGLVLVNSSGVIRVLSVIIPGLEERISWLAFRLVPLRLG